jgi:HAD superfamily hydrolase (TIGR01549 family)
MIFHSKHSSFDISALVFDKDGTLIGNIDSWKYIFYEYIQTARAMGYDIEAQADRLFGVSSGRRDAPLLTYYAGEAVVLTASALWLSYGLPWHECRRIAREIIDSTNQSLDLERIYQVNPGAIELIRHFSAMLPVCIATSDNRKATERMMKYLGIQNYIHTVITSEEVEHGKPAPDILLQLSQKLGFLPQTLLYIGDHEVDAETAWNAGAMSISLGFMSPKASDYTSDLLELWELNRPHFSE